MISLKFLFFQYVIWFARYPHVKSAENYGRTLEKLFCTIESQMRETLPRRNAWKRLLKEISDYINAVKVREVPEQKETAAGVAEDVN